MKAHTVHLLINPASRRGASDGRAVEQQLTVSGWRVERIEADGANDVSAAILRSGPDHVVAVGGDGLIHHALPALVEGSIPLGIVPSGTGNDFARALDLPKRRSSAIERGVGQAVAVDLLRVDFDDGSSTLAASAVTAGFSGRVTATANARSFPKGQLKYTAASLTELGRLEPFEMSAFDTSDSQAVDAAPVALDCSGPCSFFAVANTRYFGGGMAIAPDADAVDGLLHLTSVGAVPAWQLALVLPTVFVGQHVRHPSVGQHAGSSVRIEHDQEVWADGEVIGRGSIDVHIAPKALFVCAF